MMMGYSEECNDQTTYWDRSKKRCVPCAITPGHRVTPNCGYGDDGSQHEAHIQPCADGTFNDGTSPHCRKCMVCDSVPVRNCTNTTDTVCSDLGNQNPGLPVTEATTSQQVFKTFSTATTTVTKVGTTTMTTVTENVSWAAPLAIFISIPLVFLSVYIIMVKRKKVQHRSSYMNPSFSSVKTSDENRDLQDVLSPNILSAPLKMVLDNLDVLEELVILLDPETNGIKNTKHLASLCYFPSTWVTYAYSMKESKSPLKAVLEGVTSRHPDWTVWNLAKLLRLMDRNDAITALAKLRLSDEDLC